MNSVDMATALINRAKNMQEFTVTTEVPEDFRFNGVIPFDINIVEDELRAKVFAVDFNEAVAQLDKWLETCK
jgi:CO dehydrogenase nickel-insertion accessory protein CooC1